MNLSGTWRHCDGRVGACRGLSSICLRIEGVLLSEEEDEEEEKKKKKKRRKRKEEEEEVEDQHEHFIHMMGRAGK